jgi:hypothetical protein
VEDERDPVFTLPRENSEDLFLVWRQIMKAQSLFPMEDSGLFSPL